MTRLLALTLAALRKRHAAEERSLVRHALVAADWTLTHAAELLEVPVSTMQVLIRRHDLERERDIHRPADCPAVNRRGGRPAEK